MREEDYKNNIEVLKNRLDYYREQNKELTDQNRELQSRLQSVGGNMEKLKDASQLVESSYGEVVRAYESELEKQQKINRELHNKIQNISKALDDFGKTFIGKVFMYFFGKSK